MNLQGKFIHAYIHVLVHVVLWTFSNGDVSVNDISDNKILILLQEATNLKDFKFVSVF